MSNIYPEDGSQAPGMLPETDVQPAPTFKEQVAGARERVKGEAANFANTARDKALGAVEERQHQATSAVRDFADAIRSAGDQLSERNQGPIAQVVRQAADGLEGFTRSFENKSPQDMLYAVRDFGRRNPAAFIGGSLLIGLAIGRFIRSSMPEPDYDAADGFASPEWEGAAVGASLGSDLGETSRTLGDDAYGADLTMSPEGASATETTLDDDVDTSIGSADDELGSSGSTTRGA